MTTLYAIGQEWQRLMYALDDTGGEVTDDIALALDVFDVDERQKITGYCQVIATYGARSQAKRAEAQRLQEAAQREQKAADGLRERLLAHLQLTGRDRVETDLFTVAIRNNPPAVVVDVPAELLPERFRRTRIITEPVKGELLAAYKRGEFLPDGVSIRQGVRLEIR